MEIDPVPVLINSSHHQYYESETMGATSFSEQLTAALLDEDCPYPLSAESNTTYHQSQWDLDYNLVEQFIITPPSYTSSGNHKDDDSMNSNNDYESVKMSVSSGVQEPGRSKKGKEDTTKQAVSGGTTTKRKRHPSQVQDHILAERKRREVLSHMFISLSSMIPGLKKMDKTSILGDAIKHMKHLQEKVKVLEGAIAQHNTVKTIAVVKKSQFRVDDDSDDDDDEDNGTSTIVDDINTSGSGGCGANDGRSDNNGPNKSNSLPEIEVKILGKTLLLKIYCKKQEGILAKLFAVIDNHGMSITNCSVVPFENLALDITIVAQIGEGFDKKLKGFVRTLRPILQLASPTMPSNE